MMARIAIAGLIATILATTSGCRGGFSDGTAGDSTDLAAREARLNQLKSTPDTGTWGAPLARWIMPQGLNEISGLALTADGRLFAHPDERGIVSEIDYRRGIVLKEFLLGRRGVQGDFEGMAIVGDSMYLLASSGKIYQFREGANGARVEYSIHDLELGKECEFEALGHDSTLNSLLLVCKKVGIQKLKDHLVIYRWRLSEDQGERLSRIATPMEQLMQSHNWKEFRPTDITIDPLTGNYLIITAEHALVIVNREGAVLETRDLPASHDQPEGIAVTRDSMIIISDEAVTRPAAITLYRWP